MADKNVLRIQTTNSWLLTTDREFKQKLASVLRGRPKNYFHNAAYKKKRWDGWKYFFDAKSGKFLTGILPEVKLACKKLGFNYHTLDEREGEVQWRHTNIGADFLNADLPEGYDPIKLHDYQPDLTNQIIKYKRGIIKAPTGAGKTFVLISLIKCLAPKTPILFLTKNSGLVHQNYEEMKLWGVENVGRWYGGYKEPNFVMCATVHKNTFESLDKLLPKFKVLIVDEVHDCMSAVPIAAYKKMKKASVRIGFSATPFKYNKKKIDKVEKFNVKGHFGPLIKTNTTETGHITTAELQKRGILSASECFFYPITEPDLVYETYQDAVKMGIEENFHFHRTVTKLAKSCPGRTLIIVERIAQGEYLKQLIPDADWIHGGISIPDRQPVLKRLKEKDKHIAIAMRHIITAGINVKVHDLINASGGDAAHNLIQQFGRGLRLADDKDKLRFHDFHFLINDYLRKHSEWRMKVLEQEGHTIIQMPKIDL